MKGDVKVKNGALELFSVIKKKVIKKQKKSIAKTMKTLGERTSYKDPLNIF